MILFHKTLADFVTVLVVILKIYVSWLAHNFDELKIPHPGGELFSSPCECWQPLAVTKKPFESEGEFARTSVRRTHKLRYRGRPEERRTGRGMEDRLRNGGRTVERRTDGETEDKMEDRRRTDRWTENERKYGGRTDERRTNANTEDGQTNGGRTEEHRTDGRMVNGMTMGLKEVRKKMYNTYSR